MEPRPRRKRSKEMEPEPGRKRSKEMESKPRRKRSKQLPPELSELMDKLIKEATSFIKEFNIRESRMTEIVEELRRICEEVKSMQRKTDKVRTAGAVVGGLALGLLLLAAPFTGGLSLADAGVAAVVGSNIKKMWSESGKAEEVENLGKEFQQIVESLKGNLEEIKETCEKLEVKAAEEQSGKTLENMEEFEEILRRVSELKNQSFGAVNVALLLTQTMKNLLILVVEVIRVTATPEKDRKLRDAIIQSADQGQKVTDEFKKTQNLLKEILNL